MFETVAQKRSRQLEQPSSASFVAPAKQRPTVTYGKRNRNRPLPLQGTQFLRRDSSIISPDNDSDDEEDFVPIRAAEPRLKKVVEPDPDDSPLSEDELRAACPSNASPILSPSSSPVLATSSSKTSLEPNREASSAEKGIGKRVPRTVKKPTYPPRKIDVAKQKTRAEPSAPQRGTADTASTKQSTEPRPKARTKGKSTTRPKAKALIRLPVNELTLLPVPRGDPPSSAAAEHELDQENQDPISNTTSSGQKRTLSPIHDISDDNAKAPLTIISKRLKTPRFTHKSIAALRKKQIRRSSIFQNNDVTSKLGDGFESSELKVDHGHIFAKRRRKTLKPLLLGFSALQLQPGPLPEVKFEGNSSELQLEAASRDEQNYRCAEDDGPNAYSDRDQSLPRAEKRRVSFSDRVLSDIVRQELSSIGAPRRPISVSSDQSESDFQEFDDSDAEANEDEASDRGAESNPEPEPPAPTPPSDQQAQSYKKFMRRSPPPERVNQHATPKFSSDRRIGQPPRTLSSINRTMEVDEAILDEPDDEATKPRTLLRNENLIEVDDIILDDIEPKPTTEETDQQDPIWNREHDMLDEMEGSIYARSYNERPPPPPPLPPPQRPRSILRIPSSRFESRATKPSDTASNTRRNSTRQLEAASPHFPPAGPSRRRTTLVDLEADEQRRYFSTASHFLHQAQADPPRITKMRSNYFARQASQRGETHVQVYDSEAQVLETSPEPVMLPDYTNSTSSQLNILRRGAEATWTSSESLPREPKYLKALTRSVSREYGTLSQSVRRRPSLPFQSPTKIR
ncbi:uncharacterized protein CLAFUR5_10905 [Fulvia fulva]|uniref:Uncharacterized protein n=1 Tax=Passalora fulva TaxID=5499 RepID=A0A9Q8PF26_PASFU|nr:uncharacterized protein CLAFUR5_10905 [Fulvia fulva]UJO21259.1 hypothetical protein CLAFUR5_10905 [Fulvia fulva]